MEETYLDTIEMETSMARILQQSRISKTFISSTHYFEYYYFVFNYHKDLYFDYISQQANIYNKFPQAFSRTLYITSRVIHLSGLIIVELIEILVALPREQQRSRETSRICKFKLQKTFDGFQRLFVYFPSSTFPQICMKSSIKCGVLT